MKVSLKGKVEIISHEALVQTRYLDSVGVWTIGVGHTAAAGAPDPRKFVGTLTVAEIVELFENDLVKYENEVNGALKVPVKQHEFDALVSFHFNTGKIRKATFVKKLNAGDRVGAAAGIMAYRIPAAIIERREKEQRLFRDGVYSNNGTANLYPASEKGSVQWAKGKRVNVAALFGKDMPIQKPRPKPAPAPKPMPAPLPPIRPAPEVTQAEVEAAVEIVETAKTMVRMPNGNELMAVQALLDEKGWHEVGTVDGKWGDRTETAAFAFRNEQEPKLIPLDGGIDKVFIKALEASAGRKISQARVQTTASDLAKKGDETILETRDLIAGAGALGGTAVAGGADQQGTLDKATQALDGFDIAQAFMGRVAGALQWILQHWWIPVLGIAIYLAIKAWRVRQRRVQEHRTGQNLAL